MISPVVGGDSNKLAFKLHFRRHSYSPQPAMALQRVTSVSGPRPSIECLPTELLERIFLLTSARDILRLSLVRNPLRSMSLCTENRNRQGSIALSADWSVTLHQSNTGSIPSVLGYNETCGRKRLWPIIAWLSKRTAGGREPLGPIKEYNEDFQSPRHILVNVVSGTLGTPGGIRPNSSRWDASHEPFRGESGASRSNTSTPTALRSTLKLIS